VEITPNTPPPASPRCIRIGVGETPSECATPTPTP
jgi:NADPH-dependent glutamate synthase beta subunit-like oxidoreductase